MLGYLNWISFLGYDFQLYPNSQKISLNILTYPYISLHILSYPKISSGANSQMIVKHSWRGRLHCIDSATRWTAETTLLNLGAV